MNMGTLQIINHQEFMGGLSGFVNLSISYANSCGCLLFVHLYGKEFSLLCIERLRFTEENEAAAMHASVWMHIPRWEMLPEARRYYHA